MPKELMELLNSIKAKKQEVRDLCAKNKVEDARRAKEELKELQEKFDLLYDLEQEKHEDAEQKAKNGTAKKLEDKEKKNAIASGRRRSAFSMPSPIYRT